MELRGVAPSRDDAGQHLVGVRARGRVSGLGVGWGDAGGHHNEHGRQLEEVRYREI